jgi:hypothetical protein
MRLQTEQDTPKMERKVMSAAIGLLQLNPQETCSAKNYDKGHHHLAVFFERCATTAAPNGLLLTAKAAGLSKASTSSW